MIETFILLIFAHALADFVFQTRWILRGKSRPPIFALHIALVLGLTAAALGGAPWGLLILIGLSHAVLDAMKLWASKGRIAPDAAFALDQAGHLAVIAAAAAVWPHSFAEGFWASPPGWLDWQGPLSADAAVTAAACAAGFILATRAAGFFVAMFMTRFAAAGGPDRDSAPLPGGAASDPALSSPGLPQGGMWIGLLERGLIFTFILAGEFAAIGLLLAAKSVLRFEHAKERSHSEYIIIGTLMSLAWAIGAGLAVKALIGAV